MESTTPTHLVFPPHITTVRVSFWSGLELLSKGLLGLACPLLKVRQKLLCQSLHRTEEALQAHGIVGQQINRHSNDAYDGEDKAIRPQLSHKGS